MHDWQAACPVVLHTCVVELVRPTQVASRPFTLNYLILTACAGVGKCSIFAGCSAGPPRFVVAGGGGAKQPSAAAQAARAREKMRNVMEAPEMYKASGEELVQIERRNYLTLGEATACLPACLGSRMVVGKGGI